MRFKLEKIGISTRTVEWLRYWIKGDVSVTCAEHRRNMPREIAGGNAQRRDLAIILIFFYIFSGTKNQNLSMKFAADIKVSSHCQHHRVSEYHSDHLECWGSRSGIMFNTEKS